LKLGAFASKGSLPSPGVAAPAVTSGLTSVPGAGGGDIGGMSDSNDPLMQLFAPKTNKDEEERSKDKVFGLQTQTETQLVSNCINFSPRQLDPHRNRATTAAAAATATLPRRTWKRRSRISG
jgi:hypothetical protein